MDKPYIFVARQRKSDAEEHISEAVADGYEVVNSGVELDVGERLFWALLKKSE